jgi:DNA-binding response OmpR family regulator
VRRAARALLVSTESRGDVEDCLAAAGYAVSKATDGADAVSITRRGTFDAAVVVSTGRKMGLVETVLNLRDIRQDMPIVIVTGGEAAAEGELLMHSVPRTVLVAAQGVTAILNSFKR